MAQKVLVQLIDDLDGTAAEDVETVNFALDGVIYEIDLKQKNASKLRDSLADFVASARRSGGWARRGSTTSRRVVGEARTKEQPQAIRQWAKANGHELSDRGRIPAHIIEEFEKAHR
ncbi:histone-like nucleoid-structuring protein Lsr2 [Lentzea albida]|uniref:Lsr2 protein n=1 Tax=Lentzea albida TaxID=65499 RepID=A0A1H9X2E8_9PSEU|nr:Lsr2 family protein [Lentzea albida]SES40057.1 Lsr2 protein [Lentzea albida]